MANTLHGPFVKGASLTAGSYGTGVGQVNTYTSGNANNDETQSAVALNSFNGDLLSAFVLSGVTCTKDGTTASQLDVASGEAYLKQSDGSLARCDVASTTFSTSGNPSTTMYLDLNPDGSWSWATSHSAVANHLTICSVTTDASANIATVTDARPLNPTLLGGGTPQVTLPSGVGVGAGSSLMNANTGTLYYSTGASAAVLSSAQTGGAAGVVLKAWTGSATANVLAVGNGVTGFSKLMGISDTGGFNTIANQATAGSFGVAPIVAQAINTHITTTTATDIVTFTPGATGLYRVSGFFQLNNGTSGQHLLIYTSFYDPNNSTSQYVYNTGIVGTQSGPYDGASSPVYTNNYGTIATITVYAQAGNPVKLTYQDTGGTPNDYVSAVIERLS